MPFPPKKTPSESIISTPLEDALAKISAINQREATARREKERLSPTEKTVMPWDLPDSELWIDGVKPPSFTEYVTGKQYLNMMLYPRQEAAIVNSIGNDAREIFYPRMELKEYQRRVAAGEKNPGDVISTVLLLYGKGSGKDHLVTIVLSYLTYLVCSLSDPWDYFGHSLGDLFQIVNVAINASQAEGAFFRRLRQIVEGRTCFQKFDFEVKQQTITFRRKVPGLLTAVELVRLQSLHSNSEGFEGGNLLAWAGDELAGMELSGTTRKTRTNAMGEDEVMSPADRIYSTLRTSAASRFGKQWLGFLFSFPRSETDFMMRNYALAQKVDSNGNKLFPYIYADRGATWEINLGTSREDFEDFFEEDPEMANLMYACIPPPVQGAYFSLPERIDASFSRDRLPTIITSGKDTFNEAGEQFVGLAVDEMNLSSNNIYVAHFDPGETSDAFAFALAHPNWAVTTEIHDEEGKEYLAPQVVLDAALLWQPDKSKRRSVDFDNAAELILKVAGQSHLAWCTADRWNSSTLRQNLLKAKVRCDFDGYTRAQQIEHYRNLKAVIYKGMLRINGHYADFPALARLKTELERLVMVNGRINHPPGGSKDVADCVAAAVWLACQPSLGRQAFSEYHIDKTTGRVINSHESIVNAEKLTLSAPKPDDLIRLLGK